MPWASTIECTSSAENTQSVAAPHRIRLRSTKVTSAGMPPNGELGSPDHGPQQALSTELLRNPDLPRRGEPGFSQRTSQGKRWEQTTAALHTGVLRHFGRQGPHRHLPLVNEHA